MGGWGEGQLGRGVKAGRSSKQEMSIRPKDGGESKNRQRGKDNCIWGAVECRELKGRVSYRAHKNCNSALFFVFWPFGFKTCRPDRFCCRCVGIKVEINQGDFQLWVKLIKLWLKIISQTKNDDLVAGRRKNGQHEWFLLFLITLYMKTKAIIQSTKKKKKNSTKCKEL